MDSQFSQRVKDILGYSKEEAIRLGNSHISPEHLFLGILRDGEGVAVEILLNQGIDLFVLKGSLEKSIRIESPIVVADHEIIPLLRSTERILKLVYLEAKSLKSPVIDSEHLLLAILKDENALVTRFLSELDVDYQTVRRAVEAGLPHKSDRPEAATRVPRWPRWRRREYSALLLWPSRPAARARAVALLLGAL